MARRWLILLFITVIGVCSLSILFGQWAESFTLNERPSGPEVVQQATSQEMATLDALHARNIARLHSLYHQMKGAVKSRDANPLTKYLQALQQALDVVQSTEQSHPQWALSWAERHSRLMDLSKEIETLLPNQNKNHDDGASFDLLENKLKQMKAILDLW